MCGIIGCNFTPQQSIDKLTQQLYSRGPDYQATHQIHNNYFGHTRLSIIDLHKEANQPMIFDDLVLVFNGEIYNYEQLIIDEQLQCQTKSDSEVLIRLYQKYDIKFLSKLNGMFSFCIYDIKKDRYFCARDRYGKKPFFYACKNNNFIFASKIKPIVDALGVKPKLNKVALGQYLQYFTPIAPNTFFADLFKLEAGAYLLYENKTHTLKSKKYYKINTYKKTHDEPTALKDIENLLFKSIERRLVSDVEVGSLLSGGIDSTLISTLYSKISGKKIKTFSVGYEGFENYSELPFAKIAANHIQSEHYPLCLDKNQYIDAFDKVVDELEEPHADSAAIPLYLLTKTIHDNGIKTVLSGEGSDEIFLGYDNYAKFLKYYAFQDSLKGDQKEFLNSIISALQNQTKESEYLRRVIKEETLYKSFGEIFNDKQKKKLFKKVPTFKSENAKKDPVDWMSSIDLKIWLGEALLSKVDKMSMAHSVEVRNPFLDVHLVDYVFGIDSNIKVGNTNKYLLKKIAQKYIPTSIINRKKKGFNSPYNEWLFEAYGDELYRTILEVNAQTDFFNIDYLEFIYAQAQNNKFKQHFYSLYVFSKWYKKNF
ncbi:MAG: asparagine synthase (glutamine-hydrolyzing) [Campylobacterota bacterium]|nr:asparagine synthase (glutamine-hydrolyzing) [Campylobacterota bacterium]